MKNLLKKLKEKMVKLWITIKPKVINYLKSLALTNLLWLQRNLNRLLQRYINKLSPKKEIEITEQDDEDGDKWPGNYKDYEVYED